MIIDGIMITVGKGISEEEARRIVAEEQRIWAAKGKKIASIELYVIAGDDAITVKTVEKSPIVRTRRITGYLSTIDRFNDAKQAELEARVTHA